MPKYYLFFIVIALTVSKGLLAQQMQRPSQTEIQSLPTWAQLMYSENPNVTEVQNAYQDYYRAHTFEKTYHTQYYKRWIRQNQYFIDEQGFIQTPTQEQQIAENAFYLKKQSAQNKSTNWSVVGPITNYQEGLAQGSGQTNVYSFDQCESQQSICFCGTEPGEVYKSTNGGQNWVLSSKNIDFGSGVTALEIHPNNANFVLAGGNKGLFLSTDGGLNWTNTLPSSGLNVNEIYILPSSPNIILAATDKGLYRSSDGAQTWTQLFTQKTYDIKLKPGSSQTLYLLKNNPSLIRCEFYISTDAGLTWTLQDNGWYTSSDPARIDGGGRLAVSAADPERIYAYLIGDAKPNDFGYIGLYRSNNGGQSWILPNGPIGGPYTTAHPNLAMGTPTWNYHQGFYNCALVANPTNADEILIGGLNLYRSTDGASTFSAVSGYVGGPLSLHVDNQDFRVVGNHTWITTDGGIYHSTNFVTTQPDFYMSGVHGSDYWGFDNGWNEDVLVGGLYHNGNLAYHENYGAGNFLELGGGEAPTGYVNPGDNKRTYFSDIDGKRIPATLDGAIQNTSFGINPNESYWAAESTELVFHPNCYGIAYTGFENKLFKTTDMGASFELVQTFGSNLNEKINYIEIASDAPNVMYLNQKAASGSIGKLWKTTDGGATWTQLTTPSGNSSRMLLALNPNNAQELWMAYPSGANGFKVFRTNNGGSTWENLTSSLLNNESVQSLVHIAGTDGGIYVATNKAVYYRNNQTNFTLENNGLPLFTNGNILKPFYRDQKIRLASYGKGIYESNLVENPSEVIARMTVDKLSQTIICAIDSFYFDDYSFLAHQNATWHWTFPTGSPSTSNLRNPAVYFQTPGQHLAVLQVTAANGQTDTDSLYVSLEQFAFQSGIHEDFQQAFLPNGWTIKDWNGNGTWTLSTAAGGFGNSSQATVFNNYDIDAQGTYDDLIMPLETAQLSIQPYLYFDVAYARWGSGYSDSLQVVASTDCFLTEQVLYFKGGEILATSPDNQSFFIPSSSQWRTDSIDLSAFANVGQLQIAFRNIGDWGNCLYIDNINIGSLAQLTPQSKFKRNVYPNPACPGTALQVTGSDFTEVKLFDLNGKESYRFEDKQALVLPQRLKAGSYILQISNEKYISKHPLIIIE
ncbi:MAG: T9SS type A sorting domain-containing protein [Flavobacteriales bacterium]